MELSRWNVQEYEITDEEGDKAVILFRPLTQGWRTRHLEISLNLQRASEEAAKTSPEALEGEMSAERIEQLLKAQSGAMDAIEDFRKNLFGDLVVGSRNITINGEEPELGLLVETILSLEDLAEGLANYMLSAGQVSEAEGKS